MRKTIICILALGGLVWAWSCKKDESTTTTPSLTGLIVETAVPYVAKGDKISLKANVKGITTSDGSTPGTLGIYWQVNSADRDTLSRDISTSNPEFKYSVDTLGTYTISCYVYAESGYYNSSASTTLTCIDPATALTGLSQDQTVSIDGKQWMAKNLYNTESGADYKKASVVSPLFGRLYTWEEAVTACPSGWHLPTAEEWDDLGDDAYSLMAKAKFCGKDMWSPAIGQDLNNFYCFNAIPVGYQDKTASVDQFRRYGEYALFWTASPDPEDPSQAQLRFIRYDNDKVMKGSADKTSLAISVRCVKD